MPTGETDQRPWGAYTVLDDEAGHKVKRITVRPGGRLSYRRMTDEPSTCSSSPARVS